MRFDDDSGSDILWKLDDDSGSDILWKRDAALKAHGPKMRVFDWEKAARLIVERKPKVVRAGLRGDWVWTGGTIWAGAPDMDSYTYLASDWARPEIEIDGEAMECWRDASDVGWVASTKWPDSALEILKTAALDAGTTR